MKKGSIEMIYFSQTLWAINGNMDNNVLAKTTAKRQISSENNKYYWIQYKCRLGMLN